MTTLKTLITEIEEHTKKDFNLKNKRHFFHLNAKIEKLHSDELRRLHLIEKALKSNNGENEIYNGRQQYLRNRFNH